MRIRIESRMAEAANESCRMAGVDEPFDRTSWAGDVSLPEDEPTEALLERIFRMFNAVDDDDVIRMRQLGYELPSLSAGDVIAVEGRGRFRVNAVGFSEVAA